MTLFSLVPKYIHQFPSLMQRLSKVRHPITGDLDKFSWTKVHYLNRNINKLVCIQCRVFMKRHVEEHITAKYYNKKQNDTIVENCLKKLIHDH